MSVHPPHLPSQSLRALAALCLAALTGCPEGGEDPPADAGKASGEGGSIGMGGADAGSSGTECRCPPEHPCTPRGVCDCSEPDVDGDGHLARACGGDDCDDDDPLAQPTGVEVCDSPESARRDEDCNAATYGERDRDDDGYFDAECVNVDRQSGEQFGGDDCNDRDPSISPHGVEVCDYRDNDCDGLVDEDAMGVEGGIREKFFPDLDQDGFGDHAGEPIYECHFPASYVPGNGPNDPNDDDDAVFPGATEICDGKDNDDENGTDAVDPNFYKHIEFTATTVECVDGRLEITECPSDDVRWCPGQYVCPPGQDWCDAKVERGCDVDATRLSSCRACESDCQFSCGASGCDEVRALSVGVDHACAATDEGRVACWGRGASGQLGNDALSVAPVPQAVLGLTGVERVVAGPSYSCAITEPEGALWCWGSNASRRLGGDVPEDGATAVATPVLIGAIGAFTGDVSGVLRGVVSVALASEHTCAALRSGHVACWGSQADGRLGNAVVDATSQIPIPVFRADGGSGFFPVQDATHVALGEAHGCLLTDTHQVACWGDNSYGQLGRPASLPGSATALPVPGLSDVTALAAGAHYTCALSGGSVQCWGRNLGLQLGRDTPGDFDHQPQPLDESLDVQALSVAESHSCALTDGGELWCWGQNGSEQEPWLMGALPQRISIDAEVAAVAAGTENDCVRTQDGRALCWGANFYGQLGGGETSLGYSTSAEQVQPLAGSHP